MSVHRAMVLSVLLISVLLGLSVVSKCTGASIPTLQRNTGGTRTISSVSIVANGTSSVHDGHETLRVLFRIKRSLQNRDNVGNSTEKLINGPLSEHLAATENITFASANIGTFHLDDVSTVLPEEFVGRTEDLMSQITNDEPVSQITPKKPVEDSTTINPNMLYSTDITEYPVQALTLAITEDATMLQTTTKDTPSPTITEDPTSPTTTEDLTTPSTTDDPTSPTVTDDPSSPTTTEDLPSPHTTEDLTSPTTTGDLTTPSTTDDPTSPTITEDPTSPTTTEDLPSPRTTEDLTSPTTTEDPTSPPTTEDSTLPTSTEVPTLPTTTEVTTEDALSTTSTEDPTSPTTTEDPTLPPTTEDPTSPTSTEVPTLPTTTEVTTEDASSPTSTEDPISPPTTEDPTSPTSTEVSTLPTTTEVTTEDPSSPITTENPTTPISTDPTMSSTTPEESTSGNTSEDVTTESSTQESTTDYNNSTTSTSEETTTEETTQSTSTDINVTNDTDVPPTEIPPDKDVSVVAVAGILGVLLLGGLLATGAVMYRQGKLPWKARNSHGSVRPLPIPLSRFEHQCNQLLETPARLGSEYQLLQTLSADVIDTNTFVTAQLPDNKKKNRYVNILPYDLTRVKLEVTDDYPSDYINASFVKGFSNSVEYIASQGPKEETLDDFWRMIHQQHVRVIAMVTNFEEGGKRKCEPYFPKLRDQMLVGDSIIRCTTELNFPMYIQRTLVMHKGDKKRNIIHLHFNEWPDFGCPEGTNAMLQFCGTLRHHITRNSPGLALVHCSAGVGRTGTLIALDILLQHIQENKKVDIFGTVYKLRKQRTNMVQTEGQYAYIYKCIKDALQDSTLFKQDNSPTNSLEPIYENIPTKLTTFQYDQLPDTKGKINSSESECEL